jgi:hypothetical protein
MGQQFSYNDFNDNGEIRVFQKSLYHANIMKVTEENVYSFLKVVNKYSVFNIYNFFRSKL